jgi:exopolysaccharide biosynthesis polyprenyl glycosylphosphotransferase
MFESQRRASRILFGLSDLALTLLAFGAAYLTRRWLPFQDPLGIPMFSLVLTYCVVTWAAVGQWLGVHDNVQRSSVSTIVRNSFRQVAVSAVCLVLFEFILRLGLSRFFLIAFAAYSWLFLLSSRLIATRVTRHRRSAMPREVLIIGTGHEALAIATAMEEEGSIRIRGFLAASESPETAMQLKNRYPVFPLAALPRMLREQVIDEVYFAVEPAALKLLEDEFLLCNVEGVRMRVPVNFLPSLSGSVCLETLGQSNLLTFSGAPDTDLRLLVKRMLDVVLATLGIIATSPIMAVVAIAVKLTSPGPAIFQQERCGLNGRKFRFYKFRSMCADAEARYDEVSHLSQRTLATKIPNDPRLTRIGRFLRKFSLDELPQFFNVLRGDMSLVGPRPAIPREVAQYERWQRRRLRMRPGLTCLWVMFGRDQVDFDTWMKLDLEYIDNWSLGLDWKILVKTIPSVVIGKGAS